MEVDETQRLEIATRILPTLIAQTCAYEDVVVRRHLVDVALTYAETLIERNKEQRGAGAERIEKASSALSTSLQSFPWNTRAWKTVVCDLEEWTLLDLIKTPSEKILSNRQCGIKTLNDIRRVVRNALGPCFGTYRGFPLFQKPLKARAKNDNPTTT